MTQLLLRPGARYECHGDGTCCTDIHVVGPLTRAEARAVRAAAVVALPLRKGPVVTFDEGIEGEALATRRRACVFLNRAALCGIHAGVGPAAKPAACRRFPLGATDTPRGLRVTVSHRCACVTVGASSPLVEGRARAALSTPGSGRIERDHEVGKKIRWRGRVSIEFDRYLAWERSMLASLDRDDGPSIEQVLGVGRAARLPTLRKGTWTQVAKAMERWTDGEPMTDGFACTLRWAEWAIRGGLRRKQALPPRPWSWTFGRAAARALEPRRIRGIYGAWLADELWGMGWTEHGSVYRAMADMRARYGLGLRVATGLQKAGLRPDLAVAESVMVMDTVGAWDTWQKVRAALLEPDAGAFG